MTESINEISKDNHRLKTENQQLNALNQQLNKTEQLLKSTNQQLMADEEELRIVHNDLIERVRELNCMFGMSELVEQHDLTLYDFFTQLVQLIPPAWKYPDITCARITFDSKEYNTNNFKPTRWMLSAAINVSGQKAGVIEVCYLKEMPMIDEGPFLKQERILLDAMAHRSGELIEHRKTTEQMNAAVQQLKASNQQLQAAEQQLRASNQQLKAGQQQLTSANQQLRATEQQLRASNQQLIADEQQLNAANQQLKANEKELRHSRARYKAMFDFTMSGIAVYEGINNGNNFVIRDFNPAAEKIEKVSKQDIMARDVQDVFPGIQKMGLLDVFKRVWKTGKAELFPLVQYKDDRIEGWRENFVFKLPSGELVAIFKDLTKLKQTEEALIDNEARLSTIMNNLPDMSYQCKNDEHWTMLFVNDACKQLTGYQPAQLIDNKDVSYNDLIHPDDKTFVRQQVDQAINAGKPYELEYRIISADGKVKWVWERGGQRISHDNQNVLEGLIRDITGRKRMEKMLRDSERRNLALLEGSPVCNKIIDLDSRLLYMSAAGISQLKISDIRPYYGKPY
ncbi:MAG: PAS domain S-box protein, partial [Anaerohalosphaera sp.]|nr:PAS domain S-box protein [Anaerohalosphaera sp.]